MNSLLFGLVRRSQVPSCPSCQILPVLLIAAALEVTLYLSLFKLIAIHFNTVSSPVTISVGCVLNFSGARDYSSYASMCELVN